MHQYNVGAPFERIAIDVAGPFTRIGRGNRSLLIAMDYFTKSEAYAIPNQEASTVAEVLVNNFFCRLRIPREPHSNQGRNVKSWLLQEILQHLGVSKTRTTPLHPHSDGMVERYIKMIEEHIRKVAAPYQRDWDKRLPLFRLAYSATSHDTTGLTPASLVFGQELRLPCDLLFGVPPDRGRTMIDHAVDLVDHLKDIHPYARQHLNLASDRMKTWYDKIANSTGYHEGDRVWLYRPICVKGKSLKLQSSWQGSYKVVTWINDVVTGYRGTLGQR
jgi:hypothetical protein